MVRFLGIAALRQGRFRPSVHLYPPLVLLSCLVASTAAPAVGSDGRDALAELQELRELLVPGFGREPELLIGVGGITVGNPVTGTVVPAFQVSSSSSSGEEGGLIDGFVVPSGYFLARSGGAPGGTGFRLTSPLAFRWTGTASTPPLQLTWQAGTLFDNVFDGATGSFVPFRVVPPPSPAPGEAPATEPLLALPAEPVENTPGPDGEDGPFDTALLPPDPETPSEQPPGQGPDDQPGEGGDGPGGEGPAAGAPDPASVPGPLPLAGVAIAWRCSRRLRQRLRQPR